MAVASFLAGASGFMDIPDVVGAALEAHENRGAESLEAILEADGWARACAAARLNGAAARGR